MFILQTAVPAANNLALLGQTIFSHINPTNYWHPSISNKSRGKVQEKKDIEFVLFRDKKEKLHILTIEGG